MRSDMRRELNQVFARLKVPGRRPAMIVWINGAFGVGKTTVAQRLVAELSGAALFDPEWIGFVIQRFTAEGRRAADFQDVARWRAWTVRCVLLWMKFYEPLIVPMTIVERTYFEEVVDEIRARAELRHFSLIASPEVIRARLDVRGDAAAWAEAQIPRCVAALAESRFAEQIATDDRSIDEIVAEIRTKLAH
jgi:cytidylate kinase